MRCKCISCRNRHDGTSNASEEESFSKDVVYSEDDSDSEDGEHENSSDEEDRIKIREGAFEFLKDALLEDEKENENEDDYIDMFE